MHNIKTNFDKIEAIIKQMLKEKINKAGNFTRPGPQPKFSDTAVLALSLTAEALGIDSENNLFEKLNAEYKSDFPALIDRSQYNRRRRGLRYYTEELRKAIVSKLVPGEDYFVVDSMPVEVCKKARARRSSVCKQVWETAPDSGYCASQDSWYYGYKLHGVTTISGVFYSFDMSKASVHDIHFLKDVSAVLSNCTLLGDKGYLSKEVQLDLFESCRIKLQTPMRRNQKNYKPQPWVLRKTRKRIETLFSQLCDQFMIRRNYAKTFIGISTRVLAKITALTLLQLINMQKGRNINLIKSALC